MKNRLTGLLLLFLFILTSPVVRSQEHITPIDQLVRVLEKQHKYQTWTVRERTNVTLEKQRSATTVILRQTEWKALTPYVHRKGSKNWKEYHEKEYSYHQLWAMPEAAVSGSVDQIKQQLQPTNRPGQTHRELIYLGHNHDNALFGYTSFRVYWVFRRKKVLHDGEDPIALAVGILHHQTSDKTHASFLRNQGVKAIPYLQRALENDPKRPSNFFSVLARMDNKRAAEIVIDHLDAERDEMVNAARMALLRYPTKYATSQYKKWLKDTSDEVGVMEMIDIVKKQNLQELALPKLKAYLQQPRSVSGYVRAYRLKRQWTGNPLSEHLRTAEKQLWDVSRVDRNQNENRERTTFERTLQEVQSSGDQEALITIGLSLLTSVSRANEDWTDQAGVSILKSVPKKNVRAVLSRIHTHADQAARKECQEIYKQVYDQPLLPAHETGNNSDH